MLLRPLLLAAALAAPFAAPAQTAQTADGEARVIVRFRPQADSVRAKALALRAGAAEARDVAQTRATGLGARTGQALTAGLSLDERTHVMHARGLSSAELARRLAADAEVELVTVDGRRKALALPNDPLFGGATVNAQTTNPDGSAARTIDQWYLKAPGGSTNPAVVSNINALAAWGITTGASSVVVAVIDTGVRRDHPDFTNVDGSSQFLSGYDFIGYSSPSDPAKAIANRPAGADLTLALDYGDWVSSADLSPVNTLGSNCTSADIGNSSWHGTRVSGLIAAASNNGLGMAGVGWGLKILPLRVLGKCGGYDSDIIAAMKWAVGLSLPGVPANANKAKVLNLSLGGSGSCAATDSTGSLYRQAIDQVSAAGATVVVAAGNSEGQAVGLPGNCPGVVSVAALRHVGTKVGFSSIGPEVAIAAPGGNCVNSTGACLYPILTATNTGTTTASSSGYTYSNSSSYSVGTSFATPMVAGAAALMLSVNPALKPAQIKSLLQSTARSFPTQPQGSSVPLCTAPTTVAQDECYCTTSTCGAGLLDVGAAVAAAANGATPTAAITASATTVTAGTTLSLDGSGSTAPGTRSITGWQWTITSGSAIASLSGATNAATASLKTTGIGSVTVQLTVTDSTGLQASRTQAIAVTAPAAPTVGIVASASAVSAGTAVSLDGGSSQAATGFAIAGYQWSVSASPSNLASFTTATNAATATLSTLGSSSGSVVVTLTVTDSLGQTSSASTTVTVTALGPTASISPSATTVVAGNNVGLDSSGSSAPAGRTLTGYQWSITSGSAAFSGSTTGSTATVTTRAAGSFTVQLTLTDSAGAQASQTQTITVTTAAAATGGSAGGSGSGGGAMSAWWLLALALAASGTGRRRTGRRSR